mmetsp:Transcript_40420/g.129790  ORF Transcript_40420/g.129790 Transcript_40420/m.129790 type:complete len:516 (+) Transcript_40420:930-2477(+)
MNFQASNLGIRRSPPPTHTRRPVLHSPMGEFKIPSTVLFTSSQLQPHLPRVCLQPLLLTMNFWPRQRELPHQLRSPLQTWLRLHRLCHRPQVRHQRHRPLRLRLRLRRLCRQQTLPHHHRQDLQEWPRRCRNRLQSLLPHLICRHLHPHHSLLRHQLRQHLRHQLLRPHRHHPRLPRCRNRLQLWLQLRCHQQPHPHRHPLQLLPRKPLREILRQRRSRRQLPPQLLHPLQARRLPHPLPRLLLRLRHPCQQLRLQLRCRQQPQPHRHSLQLLPRQYLRETLRQRRSRLQLPLQLLHLLQARRPRLSCRRPRRRLPRHCRQLQRPHALSLQAWPPRPLLRPGLPMRLLCTSRSRLLRARPRASARHRPCWTCCATFGRRCGPETCSPSRGRRRRPRRRRRSRGAKRRARGGSCAWPCVEARRPKHCATPSLGDESSAGRAVHPRAPRTFRSPMRRPVGTPPSCCCHWMKTTSKTTAECIFACSCASSASSWPSSPSSFPSCALSSSCPSSYHVCS